MITNENKHQHESIISMIKNILKNIAEVHLHNANNEKLFPDFKNLRYLKLCKANSIKQNEFKTMVELNGLG